MLLSLSPGVCSAPQRSHSSSVSPPTHGLERGNSAAPPLQTTGCCLRSWKWRPVVFTLVWGPPTWCVYTSSSDHGPEEPVFNYLFDEKEGRGVFFCWKEKLKDGRNTELWNTVKLYTLICSCTGSRQVYHTGSHRGGGVKVLHPQHLSGACSKTLQHCENQTSVYGGQGKLSSDLFFPEKCAQ